MVAVQGAGEPQSPYVLVQNFESMTSNQDVTGYYDNLSVEPGCTGELSLSNNGGYNDTKAVRVDFSLNSNSSWIRVDSTGDNFTASGDGFSFWISVDQPMRCKILVIDAYIQHTHDLITLDVGKNFVQVPWDDCEGTAEWDPSLYSVIAPNNPANNIRVGILLHPVSPSGATGTAYIDELGYMNMSAANPADTAIRLISDIGTVTPASESSIAAARAAYEGLTGEQRAEVTNADVLANAIAKFDSFRPTILGASIRVSAPWGLRFGTRINNNAANGTGYRISRYGSVLLAESKWVEGELKADTPNSLNSEGFILSESEVSVFGVTVVNIQPENFNKRIMVRSYIVYENETTGDKFTVYNAEGTDELGSKAFICSTREVADYFKIDISDMSGGTAHPYEVLQNFDNIASQAQLEMFYPYVAIDEDSQLIMSLSENGGYKGSKAAKFEYTRIAWWSNIGDPFSSTNRYHAIGDGFSFWINTDRAVRVRLDVYDGWEYEGETITLSPGEQFVQIPWTSVKRKSDPTVSIVPNNPENSLSQLRIAVFNDGTNESGTFYIDEVGYFTSASGYFEASLILYHPGLPEYDAEYDIVVKNDGVPINSGFTLRANDARVEIQGGKVTVPYSVREQGKDVIVTATSTSGQSSSVIIPSKKWDITFNDDFDGNDLDPTKWSVFEPELSYGSAPSYCARDCYEVSDGTLKLLAKKRETVLNGRTYQYTDGAISTENKFTQSLGCYVSAMRYEPWSGICGGFWLLPEFHGQRQSLFFDGPRSDLGCGEVDIIEWSNIFGDRYCVTEHFWNYNTNQHSDTNHVMASPQPGKMYDGQFHAIGVVITESNSYYYCDEELVGVFEHSYTTLNASGETMYPANNFMLFSYRMGPDNDSNWVGRWNFDDSDFPLKYEVDWCRAYK